MPGCRISTCEIVNKYITAGRVVRDGRIVLYVDKSQIPWCPQGLKISVDSRFGGPLVAPGTSDKVPDTFRIQAMFVLCSPAPDPVVSAVVQEGEDTDDDTPVATFATTRSKAKRMPFLGRRLSYLLQSRCQKRIQHLLTNLKPFFRKRLKS